MDLVLTKQQTISVISDVYQRYHNDTRKLNYCIFPNSSCPPFILSPPHLSLSFSLSLSLSQSLSLSLSLNLSLSKLRFSFSCLISSKLVSQLKISDKPLNYFEYYGVSCKCHVVYKFEDIAQRKKPAKCDCCK